MEFEAIDLIGLIDKTTFYGGMYNNVTVEDLCEEIFTSAGLESDEYEIQEDLKNIQLTGYIPICTHREALQQVVFAIGAIADDSRSTKIRIYTIVDEEDNNTIEQTNIFQNTRKVEQNEIVTEVAATAHNYVQGGESEEVFKGILSVGRNRVLFDEPVYNLSCTGGTIIESNCNYAIINCTTEREVVVTGYKYVDNTQEISVEVEDLSSTSKLNTLKIESAYFINKSNAQTIAQKVLDYYQKTYKTEFEFIVEEESLTQDVAIESNSFSRQLVGHN